MGMDGFWSSLVSNAGYDLLKLAVVPVVGVLVALLKKYKGHWAGPVMYGLGASTLTLILFLAFSAWAAIPAGTYVNSQNVETYIHSWLDADRFSVQRIDDDQSNFRFRITKAGSINQPIDIFQPKESPQWLVLHTGMTPARDVMGRFLSLSSDDKNLIDGRVRSELLRSRVYFAENSLTYLIYMRVPITHLDESVFWDRIFEMDSATQLAMTTVQVELLNVASTVVKQ